MHQRIKDHFQGRKIVVATMHGKEKIIGPLLETALGVQVFTPPHFDTDRFGTFSGETERRAGPVEAARMKCRLACKEYGCSLAIASEGSFGPHPTAFFVPADDEIILMTDAEHNMEFKARALSTKTNFNGALLTSWQDAEKFSQTALFPGHGLIVRKGKGDVDGIIKGIRSWDELKQHVEKYLAGYGQVFLETDMRAIHNPTRMTVIAEATNKLIENINRVCPNCHAPGFDIVEVRKGLPCSQCGAPTRSTLSYVYGCQRCNYNKEQLYPKYKTSEDPMYCDWCNP